jgi:phosphatidylinositol glycan class T
MRYAVLPKELVCTENLTPWIQLLPCLDRAGLAMLLNSKRIYRSLYHSMRVYAYPVSTPSGIEHALTLTLVLVLDPHSLKHGTNAPLHPKGLVSWTLSSLFEPEASEFPICSGASTEIRFSFDRTGWDEDDLPLTVLPERQEIMSNRTWKLVSGPFDKIGLLFRDGWNGGSLWRSKIGAPVVIDRRLVDQGQERGFLITRIKNQDPDSGYLVTCLDLLPWSMIVYMHTWTLTAGADQVVHVPAVPRQRPNMIEYSLWVPPNATIQAQVAFDRAYLRLSDYPFDSSRGLDVPGGLMVVAGKESNFSASTSTLLLTIPLSDTTMPFNVITFTCTVWAVFYGPLFNLMYRPFEAVRSTV